MVGVLYGYLQVASPLLFKRASMPQDKLTVRKIRDVLRYRHSADLSLEAIAGALSISKGGLCQVPETGGGHRIGPAAGQRNSRWGAGMAALSQALVRASAFTEPDYARVPRSTA